MDHIETMSLFYLFATDSIGPEMNDSIRCNSAILADTRKVNLSANPHPTSPVRMVLFTLLVIALILLCNMANPYGWMSFGSLH